MHHALPTCSRSSPLRCLQSFFMELNGITPRLRGLFWIDSSDEVLCKSLGFNQAELEGGAWREDWARSERARRYGLDRPQRAAMAQRLERREKAWRAKLAARRQEEEGQQQRSPQQEAAGAEEG